MPLKYFYNMVLSVLKSLVVTLKLGASWLFNNIIAAAITLLLTMIGPYKKMAIKKRGATARWSELLSGRNVGRSLIVLKRDSSSG